jgi:hypothetical protein
MVKRRYNKPPYMSPEAAEYQRIYMLGYNAGRKYQRQRCEEWCIARLNLVPDEDVKDDISTGSWVVGVGCDS